MMNPLAAFVHRWYPVLWTIAACEIAVEIAAFAAQFDPSLGPAAGHVLFAPWAWITWMFAPKTPAVLTAIGTSLVTLFVAFLILLQMQTWDRNRNGRDWGAWNGVLVINDVLGRVTLILRGMPPD
jgi:hypothetical protein